VRLLAVAYAAFAIPLGSLLWQIVVMNAVAGAIIGWFVFPNKSREEEEAEPKDTEIDSG